VRWQLALVCSLATSGCVSLRTHDALTVRDVNSNLVGLHGKTIRVRGWLDRCQYYSCHLFATKEGATNPSSSDDVLSIGATEEFNEQALNRGPAEVIIVARANADCRTKYVCMDRAHELEPIAIRFLGKK
jgi:hypothetical protein